jgi:hypothetical protein
MGVPTHRLEIRKTWSGHNWSNDYQIEAPDMADAEGLTLAILAFERAIHLDVVTFVYWRVSTVAVGDRIFRHQVVNLPGLLSPSSSELLPLFNTARLDMATVDSDPCRKYYRIPLTEAQQANGVIVSGVQTSWNALFATCVAAWPSTARVVSGAGHNVIGGTIFPNVQMRQLHRHKRPPLP